MKLKITTMRFSAAMVVSLTLTNPAFAVEGFAPSNEADPIHHDHSSSSPWINANYGKILKTNSNAHAPGTKVARFVAKSLGFGFPFQESMIFHLYDYFGINSVTGELLRDKNSGQIFRLSDVPRVAQLVRSKIDNVTAAKSGIISIFGQLEYQNEGSAVVVHKQEFELTLDAADLNLLGATSSTSSIDTLSSLDGAILDSALGATITISTDLQTFDGYAVDTMGGCVPVISKVERVMGIQTNDFLKNKLSGIIAIKPAESMSPLGEVHRSVLSREILWGERFSPECIGL